MVINIDGEIDNDKEYWWCCIIRSDKEAIVAKGSYSLSSGSIEDDELMMKKKINYNNT